jgi:hypothetical protein
MSLVASNERITPGPCVRCGAQGPWDDTRPGMQYGPRLEERESHWYFEPKKDDPDCFHDYSRPVCPDCTTWEERWQQSKSAREMIERTRARGLPLSENENMWLGEIAEIAAHLKLDAEDRERLLGGSS